MTSLPPTWWSPSSGLGFLRRSDPEQRKNKLNKTRPDSIDNLLVKIICSTLQASAWSFFHQQLWMAAAGGKTSELRSLWRQQLYSAKTNDRDFRKEVPQWYWGCLAGRRNRLDRENSSLGSKAVAIKGNVCLRMTSVSLPSTSCCYISCWKRDSVSTNFQSVCLLKEHTHYQGNYHMVAVFTQFLIRSPKMRNNIKCRMKSRTALCRRSALGELLSVYDVYVFGHFL